MFCKEILIFYLLINCVKRKRNDTKQDKNFNKLPKYDDYLGLPHSDVTNLFDSIFYSDYDIGVETLSTGLNEGALESKISLNNLPDSNNTINPQDPSTSTFQNVSEINVNDFSDIVDTNFFDSFILPMGLNNNDQNTFQEQNDITFNISTDQEIPSVIINKPEDIATKDEEESFDQSQTLCLPDLDIFKKYNYPKRVIQVKSNKKPMNQKIPEELKQPSVFNIGLYEKPSLKSQNEETKEKTTDNLWILDLFNDYEINSEDICNNFKEDHFCATSNPVLTDTNEETHSNFENLKKLINSRKKGNSLEETTIGVNKCLEDQLSVCKSTAREKKSPSASFTLESIGEHEENKINESFITNLNDVSSKSFLQKEKVCFCLSSSKSSLNTLSNDSRTKNIQSYLEKNTDDEISITKPDLMPTFLTNELHSETTRGTNLSIINRIKRELESFFDFCLRKTTKERQKHLDSIFSNFNLGITYTFPKSKLFDKNIVLNLGLYQPIKLINMLKNLEYQFLIRYSIIERFLWTKRFQYSYFFKNSQKGDEKTYYDICNFFCTYFYNTKLRRYFHANTNEQKNLAGQKNFYSNLNHLISNFNINFIGYAEDIKYIYFKKNSTYFNEMNKLFYIRNHFDSWITISYWVTHFFNNETNKILLIIFPECKVFIEYLLDPIRCKLQLFKRFHLFFSILAFKFHLLKDNLKYRIQKLSGTNETIIDSNFFNLFFLDMRYFIAVSAMNLLDDEPAVVLLFFKAFLAFVRLEDPEFLQYFRFDDFYECDKCIFNFIKDLVKFRKEVQQFEIEKFLTDKFIYYKLENFSKYLANTEMTSVRESSGLDFHLNMHNKKCVFRKALMKNKDLASEIMHNSIIKQLTLYLGEYLDS